MADDPYAEFKPAQDMDPYAEFAPASHIALAQQEDPTSLRNLAGAAVEPMLSMGSGMLAQPIAGLAGLGAEVAQATGLTDKDPADVVKAVQGAMTYEPRTTGGKNAMTAFSYPFERLAKGADWAGEQVDDDTPEGHARAALLNAAIQTVPQILIGHGLAKVGDFTPSTPPAEVAMLADKGVTMTPGQIKGGWVNRLEQGATSIPIIGDFVRNARAGSVVDFGDATINDALAHIGDELPKDYHGHEAIGYAQDKLGAAYDNLLPKLSGDLYGTSSPQTPPLITELTQLRQQAKTLPDQQRADFNRILDDEVVGKFSTSGLISGDDVKSIRETLNSEYSQFKSGGPYDRKLADAISDTKDAIDRMMTDQNPQYADEMRDLNMGYAKFKIAQNAATKAGKDGLFTPAQYLQAVRSSGARVSKDNARYAKGEALQQPIGAAGANVLGVTLPDSGTAYRWWLERGALGTGGGLAALGHPAVGLALATVPAMYSKLGLRAMQPMLLGETPAIGKAASAGAPEGAEEAQTVLEDQAQGHAEGGYVEPEYASELHLLRQHVRGMHP